MVSQNSADFSTFRGQARQRGRRFVALAQTRGRTAIPFIKGYIIPSAKRIGADLFEIAALEVGEIVTGRKKLESIAKEVGTKTVRKQLGVGRRNPSVELTESNPFLEKVYVALAKTSLTTQNEYKSNYSFPERGFYKLFIGDF